MHIGYARVSTGEQKLDLQLDALKEAGCQKIYQEQTSGAAKRRPELERCLEQLRGGDTLVVWRLDRFGRSLKDLVGKMEALEEKGVGFKSLTEGIDTTTAQGRLTFHIFGAWRSSSVSWPASGRWRGCGRPGPEGALEAAPAP